MTTQYTDEMNEYASISAANHMAYAQAHGYHYFRGRGRLSGEAFLNPGGSGRISKEGLFWQKLPAVERGMNACYKSDASKLCSWVMWLDGDTLITNFDTRLEDIIVQATSGVGGAGAHVILAREEAGFSSSRSSGPSLDTRLNAGVYFVKNSAEGRTFLDSLARLYPFYKNEGLGDQPAIQDYVFRHDSDYVLDPASRSDVLELPEVHFSLMPQRAFNAFPYDDMPTDNLARWLPGCFIAHFAGMGKIRVASMKKIISEQGLPSALCPPDSDDTAGGLVHLWQAEGGI